MHKISPRIIEEKLQYFATKFPVISLTGARQSGKTTILKKVFPQKPYVSLEDPNIRLLAREDPKGFLSQYPKGVIIDEAQNVPEIFSYLQLIVDQNNIPGQFILSGSKNFLLKKNISQSLAGRVAILHLFPFELAEKNKESLNQNIFMGGYPRIYQAGLSPNDWFPSYIQTYLERDITTLISPKNLRKFQIFLRLCAGRAGQILSYTNLANEADVSVTTIQSWLGILEQSFIAFVLPPYYKNFNKRLIKSPKLYFYDTGLLCHLLGIKSAEQVQQHFAQGALFENLIISNFKKSFAHRYSTHELFYFRDSNGNEVDLIIDQGSQRIPIEIKCNQTARPKFLQGLNYFEKISDAQTKPGMVIYGGSDNHVIHDQQILSWKSLAAKNFYETYF
jgi:predicted AAA+ superfamily ATPase